MLHLQDLLAATSVCRGGAPPRAFVSPTVGPEAITADFFGPRGELQRSETAELPLDEIAPEGGWSCEVRRWL